MACVCACGCKHERARVSLVGCCCRGGLCSMHLARPVLDPSPIPWLAARVGRCRVERPFSAAHGPLFPVRPLYFLHVFADTSKGTAGTSSFLLCAPRPQRRRRGVVQLGTHGESWEGRLGCRRGGHLSEDRCGSGRQPCPAPDVSSGWLLLPAVAAGPRPPARPPSRGGGGAACPFSASLSRVTPVSPRQTPTGGNPLGFPGCVRVAAPRPFHHPGGAIVGR